MLGTVSKHKSTLEYWNLLLVTIVGSFPFASKICRAGTNEKIFSRSLKTFSSFSSNFLQSRSFCYENKLGFCPLDVSVRILSSTKFNLSLLIRFIAQSVIVIQLYMKGVPKWPKQIRAWVNFEMGFERRQEKSFFSRKNIDSLSSDDTFLLRNVFPSRFHCGFHVATECSQLFSFFACLHRHYRARVGICIVSLAFFFVNRTKISREAELMKQKV